MPHLQNNQSKMDGGVTQAIECLLCKWKALTSNPSTTKKKKKKTQITTAVKPL
jgi:hypothetical protein